MPIISEISNPFDPRGSEVKTVVRSGTTPRDYVDARCGKGEDFAYPTILILNGVEIMREDWDKICLAENDHAVFRVLPGWAAVPYIIGALIGAVAYMVLAPDVPNFNDRDEQPSVYNLSGQRNFVKLGSPIQDCYGRNRQFPPYAARTYNRSENNEQFLFSLFCIGQGEYDIEQILIEDTDISNFEEVTYEIYRPGELVTLFPDNIVTSSEVSSIELYGPNEDDYTGYSGPFVANDSGTKTNKIEVDIILPNGLYYLNDEGSLVERTAEFEIQYREIDDLGASIGDWQSISNGAFTFKKTSVFRNVNVTIYGKFWVGESVTYAQDSSQPTGTKTTLYSDGIDSDNANDHESGVTRTITEWYDVGSLTLATDSPQRFTIPINVTSGRYEVRARRTNNADLSTRSQDQIDWYQLRAELPSTKDYGNVTLMAVKAKATNNLNDSSKSRFNVICTRKLPIWNGSTWSANTATRSIVWAFCNVVRSSCGANLSDSKLQLSTLLEMDAAYASRQDYFDWIFDTRSTIWDALDQIASSGRAKAVIQGTRFGMVRDEPKTIPTAAFGPENIVRGTFGWSIGLQPESDYDGIECEYLDHDTFKQETVKAILGTDLGENTEKVTITGITNRDKAYQQGLYIRAKQIIQREQIEFTTGKEGELLSYGDLIAVSHDAPTWGSASGFVNSIESDNCTVNLSESLDGVTGNVIAFRDKLGQIDGPYSCTVASEFQVVTASPILGDFLFNSTDEPPIFFFGTSSKVYKKCLVRSKSASSDDDTVSISAVNYSDAVYAYDGLTATPIGVDQVPSAPNQAPSVTGLSVVATGSNLLTASVTWDAADGAIYYAVAVSYDSSASWTVLAYPSDNFYSFIGSAGSLSVRVAAIAIGQGPWTTATGALGSANWVDSGLNQMVDSDGNNLIFN